VSLHLYDTGSRAIRRFEPLREGHVGMYVCGATPQAAPHIGHLRSGVVYDLLRRWLAASGYQVTLVRNVTDVDDKIIAVAAQQEIPWFAVAEANQRIFNAGYDTLGCLPPTVEPRATGHVPEMIVLMRRLIDRGHAYNAGNDVYFDVRSWVGDELPLSRQRLENMRAAGDSPNEELKKDPIDFALWKGVKPGEPCWETPWGPGRPGWHLECSAMAAKYLGETFDIHGGGVDLIFPHHENELAQSRAAGDGFARYWVHNGLLTVNGEKMSKSIGNVILLPHLLERARPVEVRYYLGAAHYRSLIDYSDAALADAVAAYQRIEGFVTRAAELVGAVPPDTGLSSTASPVPGLSGAASPRSGLSGTVPPRSGLSGATSPGDAGPYGDQLPADFTAALDDDLNVPQALAVIHEAVREGNSALASGQTEAVRERLAAVRAMTGVLGFDPLSAQWATTGGDDLRETVDKLVRVALDQRQAARQRKDYTAADAIREALAEAGIVVEDTPQGPRWDIKRG
jgi:cysteinyl-tRNA synthetase